MWQLHHKEWWAKKNWWFWTVVLDKTLESPLDCKEILPVILKEINPEYSLEGLMLELNLQYFGPTDVKNWLIRKDPVTGKDWRQEERGWQRMRWLDGSTNSMDMSLPSSRIWWRTVSPGVLQSTGLQRVRHDWETELNWTYHIANTICNGHVSPARLGLPMAPTYIPNQVCTHAQKSVPSIHKPFSEFWLQGDLHFSRHKGLKNTFISNNS